MSWDIFVRADLEALAAPQVWERGREYFEEGHLSRGCRFRDTLAATVIGTGGEYRVRLTFENGEVVGVCDCPYTGYCKHQVALGLAWLEQRESFIDLELLLEQWRNSPEELTGMVERLAERNPLAIYELSASFDNIKPALSSQGLLQISRNLVSFPPQSVAEAARWGESFQRLQDLIIDRLREKPAEAMAPFIQLLLGLVATAAGERSEPCWEAAEELLQAAGAMTFPDVDEIQMLQEQLWKLLIEEHLLEIAPSAVKLIINLHKIRPDFLTAALAQQPPESAPLIELLLIYDLLEALPEELPGRETQLRGIIERLQQTTEGWLCLLDRLLERDPEAAFRMAREGLRSQDPLQKRSSRNRLIRLHQERGEYRQAAAHSFRQFTEEPNFEEYRRLKELLRERPQEFAEYTQQMNSLLDNTDDDELCLAIAVDRGDAARVLEFIAAADPEASGRLAVVLLENRHPEIFACYPELIRKLLAGGVPRQWKPARSLLAKYKQYCLFQEGNTTWEELRRQLQEEFSADRRFTMRFGTLLAE